MTQRLVKRVSDWELEGGFTVHTLNRAKKGEPIKPDTAYRIAKALGCTEEEAKSIAAEYASSGEAKESA